jgi:hypothetical protein
MMSRHISMSAQGLSSAVMLLLYSPMHGFAIALTHACSGMYVHVYSHNTVLRGLHFEDSVMLVTYCVTYTRKQFVP